MRYMEAERVTLNAKDYEVTRGSVNRWLQWYEAQGIEELRTGSPTGAPPKLNDGQRRTWVRFGA